MCISVSDLQLQLLSSNSIIQIVDKIEGTIKIIAALISDEDPIKGSVTILNISNIEISLNGWCIMDSSKKKMCLHGIISPGRQKPFQSSVLLPYRMTVD